jgi:hypothetical protein
MASSSTTTATALHSARRRPQRYPADYDVRETNVTGSATRPSTQVAAEASPSRPDRHPNPNPPAWPDNYRRIPAHRPVDRHLDQSQRRVYNSVGERVFLTMMFTGLEVNVVSTNLPLTLRLPGSRACLLIPARLPTAFGSTPVGACRGMCLRTRWGASFDGSYSRAGWVYTK